MKLFLDIWQDSLDGGSAHRKVTTYTGEHNSEKHGHISMPRAGFEPTIPVFERLKTARPLGPVRLKFASILETCMHRYACFKQPCLRPVVEAGTCWSHVALTHDKSDRVPTLSPPQSHGCVVFVLALRGSPLSSLLEQQSHRLMPMPHLPTISESIDRF
jgi:hypothetical protein